MKVPRQALRLRLAAPAVFGHYMQSTDVDLPLLWHLSHVRRLHPYGRTALQRFCIITLYIAAVNTFRQQHKLVCDLGYV